MHLYVDQQPVPHSDKHPDQIQWQRNVLESLLGYPKSLSLSGQLCVTGHIGG